MCGSESGASTTAEIFLSGSQVDYGWPDEMFVAVRTAGDPWLALPFLRRVLTEVNPRAVLKDVRTMAERRAEMGLISGDARFRRSPRSNLRLDTPRSMPYGQVRIGGKVMQATITSKGQVTLPKPIRDKLHLRAGDKIDFLLEGGVLRVEPVTASVTQLKGMAPKPAAPVSLREMDAAIADAVARRSSGR